MRVKDDSVDISRLREEIFDAALRLDAWHLQETGRELVITSGHENFKHSVRRSAHYRRDAIDVRNWYLKEQNDDLELWAKEIQSVLGVDYVVLNEGTHFHIHWAPVYKEEHVSNVRT